jgi:hypothetical protein
MASVDRRKIIALVVATCTLTAGVAAAGLENFFLISGKKVVVKDNANPAKRKAVFVSTDPALDFTGVNNPTVSAMYVQFQGACTGSSVFYLPTTRWTEKNGSFKYKDPEQTDGPVTVVVAKPGQVKVVAKGAQLDLPLIGTGPQLQMAVRVETQETSWTAFFGPNNSTIKKDDPIKGIFAAVDAAAAPASATSCGGAFVE